jgi:hypothetical protein
MSETPSEPEAAFHLLLDQDEVPVTASALRLLIADEAHQPEIRGLARAVIEELENPPGENGITTVTLSAQQMKITHTAVRLLFNDLQRGQADEVQTLRAILAKLPDEHTMRAIIID